MLNHVVTISSKEDVSSVRNKGRALYSSPADICRMLDTSWRERLRVAIQDAGKSMRAVSLASGNGPGYVHSILSDGKEPTMDNLAAVCDAIPVSLIYILYGLDVSDEDFEILRALREYPEIRQGIYQIIRAKSSS